MIMWSIFFFKVTFSNNKLKQRGICLRVCPEWPAMPCMEWLPALGIQRLTFGVENDRPGPGSLRGHFEAARGRFLRLKALF